MMPTAKSRTTWLSLLALGFILRSGVVAGPLPLTGVNLAGGEFWWARKPKTGEVHPQYGKNYSYPTQAEIDYFSDKGMNLFRYQFLWETLQPQVRAPLDKADLERLKTSVRFATARKLIVLLDPHNYARYYGTNVVGGPNVSIEDFADFWRRLALEFRDEPCMWFGLVNEPHDMPTRQWFDAANASITAIRGTGANQLILVPGNSWSGAHSWKDGGDQSNAKCILSIKDPLDYWAVEVHQYVDADSSGRRRAVVSPTIGSERLKGFVDWCRQHRVRAVLGEFGVPVVPDGEQCLDDMLQSMERDRDVWLGWTWWAAGSWWGEYMFTIEPRNGQDRPQMAWLQPHLSGTNLPQFSVAVKSGKGQCNAEAGTVQTIAAGPAPPGMVFKRWTGDTAWLKDPTLPKTTLIVPFKDIRLEAVFAKAE
jgi:endoglucanase